MYALRETHRHVEPKINWWPIWLSSSFSLSGSLQGTRHWTELQAELPVTLMGCLFFLFSFFAEHIVLNLYKLNMQFSQQINSWLKMFSAKNSLFLCNKLHKCFYNSKNTFLNPFPPKCQPASTGNGFREHHSMHMAPSCWMWLVIYKTVFPIELWIPRAILYFSLGLSTSFCWMDGRKDR